MMLQRVRREVGKGDFDTSKQHDRTLQHNIIKPSILFDVVLTERTPSGRDDILFSNDKQYICSFQHCLLFMSLHFNKPTETK